MIRWLSARLLVLASLVWAVGPGVAAAQAWDPYLPNQPSQHAILGHVAGLGPVIGDDGQYIVEYDAQGTEVNRVLYAPGMFLLSANAWNAEVDQWNAAKDAAGEDNTQTLDVESYRDGSRTCFDTSIDAEGPVPVVADGVRWVLVKKVSQGLPPCDEYVLAVSTLSQPDVSVSGGSSLVVGAAHQILATSGSGNVFAFESGYFEPQQGYCPENPGILSPVLRNLVAYQACASSQVARLWAPVAGVSLETTSGLAWVPATTTGNGFFRLDYTSQSFDDESGLWVWGEVQLDAFNPRFPSSRKFYLKRRATGAGTVKRANFAVDLVQASVAAVMLAPKGPNLEAIPLVDLDYQFDEFTEYDYSPPEFGAAVDQGNSFENLPNVDFRHLGLVKQVSAIDLQATDVYLYRVSDGKLIGARRGLTPSNLLGIAVDPSQFPRAETPPGCDGSACLGLVMLTRGPASRATAEGATALGGTAPYQSAVTSAGGSDNQVSLELEYLKSTPAVDFLRPGDTVQVVVVNRVTGYLGSAYGQLQSNAGQLGIVNLDGSFGLSVSMLPPNLRVQAKRRFQVADGQTEGTERQYIIGFEGASLNTDAIVEITTTWVDHDGKPLPPELPGFTGRLASVMDDELVGEGDATTSTDGLGHFSIKPGTHTQIARIPTPRVDVGHLYVHVDAAPSDETVDFQNALIDRQPSFAVNEVCYGSGDNCFPKPLGDGSNPLEQRPAHFVPFLVPMFDEAATRAATVAQREALQEAWNEGEALPILEKVDPIYQWVYRPEFKFSVLDLDVKDTEIVTDDQGTRLIVDYTLVGGDDTQQLDPLGDNEFVFSLGYAELLATVLTDLASGGMSQAEFDDLASILGLTSGGQLSSQADALGAILSPEDFLVLQLYLQHDSANGLYEFAFGSDFNVFAESRTLEVERVHRRARYAHHSGLPEVPAYTDTYEFLSFEIKHDSSVEVVLIDGEGAETSILGPASLTADRYRFVIDYEQIASNGVTPATSPSFALQIRTSYTDENGSPATHTISYDGVIREREQGEVIGQTIVNDVAIAEGALRLEREDFRIKGKGPDLAFVRTYSSSDPSSGAIGPAWRHQLAHELVPIEAGDPTATTPQDAGIPGWVRGLQGNFIGTDETPPAGQDWIEVMVSGTRFRKFGNEWYPERGRHGTLETLQTPDGDYFVYTAMDGTRYRYRVPSLVGEVPTLDEVPVTVGDAAVYRVGVPPILNCPFTEGVADITAPNGHKLVFNYSGDNETPGVCGELASVVEVDVTDVEGRRIDLRYGSVELVEPVTQAPDGAARRLLSVTGPGGIALSFDYDGQGRLETATRATRTESYSYPTTARDPYLTSATVDPGFGNPPQAYDYGYHVDGELTLSGTSYGEFLDPAQIVKSVSLPVDQDGQRSTVDFEYDFDATNQRRVRDARTELTTYDLDDVGRPIVISGPGARYTALTWDPDSGYTQSRTERTSAGDRITSFVYTFSGHRLERTVETGPYLNTRETVYDVRFNKPVLRTDRNGYAEQWQYDIDGNPEFYEDAESKRWLFTYNEQKLLETRLAPGRPSPTVYLYDNNGYVRSTQTPVGDVTSTFYDDRGLLREREDARQHSTFYFYDALDNLEIVERPAIATIPASRPEAQSGRHFQTQQLFTWDALGRKVSETDHNGLRLDYEYDGRGLVTRIERPAVQGEDAEREFAYDPNGNLLSETDWKVLGTSDPSDVTAHAYNALNQRETTTNRVGDVMQYAYDQVGNLLHAIDYAGVKTEYTYDLLNRPLTMTTTRSTEPVGAQVEWQYYFEDDPEQNLKQMTVHRAPLAEPETTVFATNARYQRILRTNARAQEYQWVYNPDGTIDYEVDEEGLTTRRQYDDDGRVRFEDVERGSLALRTEFRYDPAGNVREIINPRDNRVEREYDEWNRMFRSHVVAEGDTRFTTEILYDGEGNVLNVHDPAGRDRSTLRDALGRVTTTIAGDSGRVVLQHDRNHNVLVQREFISGRSAPIAETQITYDAEDRELCRTEAWGTADARTRCIEQYDGVGNPKRIKDFRNAETTYAYDVNHQLIEAVLPGDDALGWTYSQNGLLVSQRDALQRESDFNYDQIGRLTLTTDPAVLGVRDTEQRFYDEVGNLTRVIDRRGIETGYTYDEFYRLQQVERAGEIVATYGYDSVGNLRYEQDGNCDRIDHCYDARNLATASYIPNGASAAGVGCQGVGTDPSLDSCPASAPANTDAVIRQYDAAGNLRTLTNEALQDTTFTYDGENRLLTQTFAGETTVLTYDEAGLVRTRRQPSGRTDTYVYDMLGRLKEARDGGLLTTTYGYDANSNLTLTALPSGAETAYTYDPRNRPETQVQDPNGLALTTRFTYDENDNLKTLTDANGQLITYGYDEKNRRKSADYPAQPGAPFYEVQLITYGYDGNDNVTGVQTQKVGPSGAVTDVTSLGYDARDRLALATYRGRDVRYAYDGANQRIGVGTGPSIVEGGSNSTVYKYDARGRVSGVVTPSGEAGYQYTPDGRIEGMTHPNGVDTDTSYTPQNRVASIEHSLGVTRLAEYAYTYDPDGNRLSETATQVEGGALVQQTRQMAYDLANRLCAVAQGQGPLTGVSLPNCNGAVGTLTGVEETRYAFLGYNRDRETQVVDGLVSSGRVYDYDGANRLSTVDRTDGQSTTLGTLTYGYDPNGNTLSVTDSTAPTETMGFVYNPRDQLVQVTRGPPGAEAILGRYDYDAQGRRIRTEALGALTEEVYDGIALLARYQGGNDDAFVHRGPSGELLGVEAPSTPMHWVHTDVLGSPIVRTDDLGGVVSSTRYGVFGDVALHEESGATPGPRFGFTGHQYDAGTELVYANARYYQPGLGRFLTQDAFLGRPQQPGSLHRYLYAAHNPALFFDPTGFESVATLIDDSGVKAAERGNYAQAFGWAALKGAYYLGTLGFAVVHDPVRDAYDRGEVTTAQYLGAGVGGGLAVAGVSLATAGAGSGFVAGGTTLAAQAGRAALIGAGEGLVTDVLTQSALVSVGVQEEFSVRQTATSTLLGATIGGAAAGAGGLVNTVRGSQFAARVTAQVKTKATRVASSARAKVANVASRVTREIPSGALSVGQSLSDAAQGVRQAARELGDLARRIEPNGVGMFGGGFRIRPKTAPGATTGRGAARSVADQDLTVPSPAGRPLRPVVLGETMATRVTPAARRLDAHTFQPRSASTDPAVWMRNQQRWIRRQIASGRRMFDIGVHRGRGTRSPYYAIERSALEKAGYRREFVGTITSEVPDALGNVLKRRFRLYEWVK